MRPKRTRTPSTRAAAAAQVSPPLPARVSTLKLKLPAKSSLKPTQKKTPAPSKKAGKKPAAKAPKKAARSVQWEDQPTEAIEIEDDDTAARDGDEGDDGEAAAFAAVIEENNALLGLPPSSPPRIFSSSPPPPEPVYDLDIQYLLRVNKKRELQDFGSMPRSSFSIMAVEDKVDSMISSEACSIQGRDFEWIGRFVQFRADHPKGSWISISLSDFNIAEEVRLTNAIDTHLKRFKRPVERVDLKLELQLKVEILQKAFRARTANEPSSEPIHEKDVGTPFRTRQLLREQRQVARAEEIAAAIDHQSSIHRMWECRTEECGNFKQWCFVSGGAHFAIHPVDCEAWARSILKGDSSVALPSQRVAEGMRIRGDQLRVNPKNKKKRRRGDSTSSGETNSRNLMRMQQQFMESQMMSQMLRMQEDVAERSERRDIQRRQVDQLYAASLPAALITQRPATPQVLKGVRTHANAAQNTTSSSPVSGAGKDDSRKTVKDFFKWLVAQQPEEDRRPFEAAERVAVEEMWTIRDLKEMAKVKSDLHDLAVNQYKLKDGVVRHFKDELRRFKTVYRAASGSAS